MKSITDFIKTIVFGQPKQDGENIFSKPISVTTTIPPSQPSFNEWAVQTNEVCSRNFRGY